MAYAMNFCPAVETGTVTLSGGSATITAQTLNSISGLTIVMATTGVASITLGKIVAIESGLNSSAVKVGAFWVASAASNTLTLTQRDTDNSFQLNYVLFK